MARLDGGTSWHDAELLTPPQPKCTVRFQYLWNWTGNEATLLSRCTDDAGYVQPTRTATLAERGIGTEYHYNQIVGCKVDRSGAVTYFGAT